MHVRRAALAIALALTAAPALASDGEDPKVRTSDDTRLDLGIVTLPSPSVGRAVDGLRHLRLRPAADGFDVAETVRRRPGE